MITYRRDFKTIINLSQNQNVQESAQKAIEKLNELRVAVKKANMPKSLILELDQAIIIAQKLSTKKSWLENLIIKNSYLMKCIFIIS